LGAAFHSDLKLPPNVEIVNKAEEPDHDSYSAFGGTQLAERLRRAGVKSVWIGGLAQDYCVRATALDAINEGFQVHLVVGATPAVNVHPEDGKLALDEVQRAGGLLEETR